MIEQRTSKFNIIITDIITVNVSKLVSK